MRARRIGGGFCLAIGAIWILQGLNILKGSSMTGDSKWAVIGVVMAAVGVGLFVWDSRVRGDAPDETTNPPE